MEKFPPEPLTRPECKRIFKACGTKSRRSKRSRTIVILLWRTGIRVSELCSLNCRDVYLLDGGCSLIRIRKPKNYQRGVSPREVGLDPMSTAVIKEWMGECGTGDDPLLTTSRGLRILPSYVRQLLPVLARKAKVNRRVHPHAFRHTFAREMYNEGVGVMELMLALGHQSLSTTQTYLQSIGGTQVVNTTTKRKW